MWPPTSWGVIINTAKALQKEFLFFFFFNKVKQNNKEKKRDVEKSLWGWFLLPHERPRPQGWDFGTSPNPLAQPLPSGRDGARAAGTAGFDLLSSGRSFWALILVHFLSKDFWGPFIRVWFVWAHDKGRLRRGKKGTRQQFLPSVLPFQPVSRSHPSPLPPPETGRVLWRLERNLGSKQLVFLGGKPLY